MPFRQPYEDGNTPKVSSARNEVSQAGKHLSDGLVKKKWLLKSLSSIG